MSALADIMADALTPSVELSAADWLRESFFLHDGRAFSEHSVPWVTAPQGPCWAMDHPQFREIWLQWAARMCKTNFGLAMLLRQMSQRPGETMFATVDETQCKSVFARFWQMIEHSPPLRDQAPVEQRQSKLSVQLARSVCHGAWPRGKSRLADKSIPLGVGNEIDKWTHTKNSTEGDPLPRFLKRGAEYADRKFVLESTPSVRGTSRIEAGRLRGTNHKYYVPCPHCGKFQALVFGDGDSPGGIFWDKSPSGKTDRQLARKSAHYVCAFCESRIDDMHRPGMMAAGVWAPFGVEINHDRAHVARSLPPDDASWIIGEPAMWGSEYGSQISVLYALFLGWGQLAHDFLVKKDHPADLRQWTNEDMAETWDSVKRKESWHDLGQRLITQVPRYVAPTGTDMITIGIDKQQKNYVYCCLCWQGDRGHTLDYGTADTSDELIDLVSAEWSREDGTSLTASAALIDSGYRPAEVHEFVEEAAKKGLPVRACRGSYGRRLPTYYINRQSSSRSSSPGSWVTYVDTHSTQDWCDLFLQDGLSVFAGSLADHQDWLQQLTNDGLVSSLDAYNMPREAWQRLDAMIPNDFRDCLRYGFVGRLLASRRLEQESADTPPKKHPRRSDRPAARKFLQRPGGWVQGQK